MSLRRIGSIFACLMLVLVMAGCQKSSETTDSHSEMLLTPLASDQIAEPSEVPEDDAESFNTFFSRWGAYVAAVGTDADAESEIYSDLLNMARNWQECVTVDKLDGGSRVLMYLPSTPGYLDLAAQGGWIKNAGLSYNTENSEVEAGLTFTVACNALVYALAWEDDMTRATDVYDQCMRELNESGAEMTGTYAYNGYEFTLNIDADTHYMTFSAQGQTG